MDKVDVLAIGAHPDDVEAGAAGFLLKAKALGKKTGIISLTQGEGGRFGSAEVRLREAKAAAQILGTLFFEALDFPDSAIEDTLEGAHRIAQLIQHSQPDILLFPWKEDYHPDHVNTYRLVCRGLFLAERYRQGMSGWKVKQHLCFPINIRQLCSPDLVIDITSVWAEKQAALRAHESQKEILRSCEMLATYYGLLGNCQVGEGFIKAQPVRLGSLDSLF